MWICTGSKLTKFHGNILSLSENIAQSFRGRGYFFDSHCRSRLIPEVAIKTIGWSKKTDSRFLVQVCSTTTVEMSHNNM